MNDVEPDAPAPKPVDWSGIFEAVDRRAWLLVETETHRVSYDDLIHRDNCNVNPLYHKGVEEVWKRGCDCGAVKEWMARHRHD